MKKPDIVDQTKPKTVRGKYIHLLERGSNIAILDGDIADHFPDSESVNKALRAFLAMSEQFASLTGAARHSARRSVVRKASPAFDPRVGLEHEKAAAAK